MSSVGAPDAQAWAQNIDNNLHRQHRLGPESFSVGALDALAWAQHINNNFHQ